MTENQARRHNRLRRELFLPTPDGEARLLLLISAFSDDEEGLEGRLKLAKLDFLLRYPAYFKRAFALKAPKEKDPVTKHGDETIESRMIRYRYGPWDPASYNLIGRLVARGLVVPVKNRYGIGLRATANGKILAARLAGDPAWESTGRRAALLRKHFDYTGKYLKEFLYENFPEMTGKEMGETV